MIPRGLILILAATVLAGVPCAAWSAEPAVGRDYYSVQLTSGRSAAALQRSLAQVAGLPYARIDKRGDIYILRVGYWESREEAVQAAQALLPKFRNAYARIASYRPDAMVAGAGQPAPATAAPSPRSAAPRMEAGTVEPPSRIESAPIPATAAVAPPVTTPVPSQAQVLGVRRDAQSNLVPDPELQTIYPLPPPREVAPPPPPAAAPGERVSEPARPSPPRGPNEEPLWALLREQRYADIDTELSRLRKAYPHWKPPTRLLALKRDAELRLRITEAVETKNWKSLLDFSRQYPEQFSCDNLEFLLGLAEAYYSQGDTARTIAVVERIVPGCPVAADRINTLQRVNALFTLEIMQQFLERELKGGQRDAEQQARFDRLVFDFQLRGLQEAVQTKDRARAMAYIEATDRMPVGRGDPRHASQVGWVLLEFEEDESAIERFEAALNWKPDPELANDLREGIALAYFRLSQRKDPESAKLRQRRLDAAEAALARCDPDDARTREVLGLIFLVRAGDAYDSKDYDQSLAYLDQAEALGRSGRDIEMRRAWINYQLGDDAKATELFTKLYRDKPDKEIADALVFSVSRSQRWNQLGQLAMSLGGPLTEVAEAANAQRYYDGKMFLNAEFAVPEYFPQLENIASTSVGLGTMVRYKPGSDGTTQLQAWRTPVVEGVKVFGGEHELRLQIDRVDLSAGNLPAGAMVGNFPAAGVYVAAPTTRLTDSIEPFLSYRMQGTLTVYAGVGVTPTNGIISVAPVGNLGLVRQLSGGNVGVEIFSQPVRETILSYTGIVDPYTGLTWGRVRRSGGLVRGYASLSNDWSVSGGAQAAHLEGVNVANNQGKKFNLSLTRSLTISSSDLFPVFDYLTVGPSLSYESYHRNLGQFTYGQGGYYSPQRVFMYGIGSQLLTREARQYMIRGGVSYGRFTSSSAASPCFPLGITVLPPNPACVTGFTASSGTGSSYSAEAVGVRRLSDHLQLGGGVIWRRSPQYDDKLGMVFVRYIFDPRPAVMSTDIPDSAFQRLY